MNFDIFFLITFSIIVLGYIALRIIEAYKELKILQTKSKSNWVTITDDPATHPVEGTEVIVYIPAWHSYVVAYVNYDSKHNWIWDTEELYEDNLPSRWLPIEKHY